MRKHEQRREDLIKRVKLVLATAGVPPSAFAKTLSSVIGVAIAQAYRKLSGASEFTLSQIEALEIEYGVDLVAVISGSEPVPQKVFRNWTDAGLVIGLHRVPCQILVGAARRPDSKGLYAAYLHRGEWHVCVAQDFTGSAPLFDLEDVRLKLDASVDSCH